MSPRPLLAARAARALVVTLALAACGEADSAAKPGPCGLVDEGAVPAEAVGASDLLAGTSGNEAQRDAWARRHGQSPASPTSSPRAWAKG